MTQKGFYGKGLPKVDPYQMKGKLFVIEGGDGSGRSTQTFLLKDWLEGLGYPTVTVGLKHSKLVGKELDKAMEGNMLSPITFSLFYATDFADQLENIIVPALKSGFLVLCDRYIYTLMARALVRGADWRWLRAIYGIALKPDAVFYLQVSPKAMAERTFQKNGALDYWESGMDIQHSRSMLENFIHYQRQLQKAFRTMQKEHEIEVINGNRMPLKVFRELQERFTKLLPINGEHKASQGSQPRPAHKTLVQPLPEKPPAEAYADKPDEGTGKR